MFLKLLDACSEHMNYPDAQYQPKDLWDHLTADGKLDLVSRLQRIQNHEDCFEWLVVPKEGFSEDDTTHNAVIDWAHLNNIRLINMTKEITELELSLHPVPQDWTWLDRGIKELEALS